MAKKHRILGVDWVAVVAAALAAVSSALILSTLGAGGTLIGAAVGSVVATLSSAMYARGLDTSRRKVRVVMLSGRVIEMDEEDAAALGDTSGDVLGASPTATTWRDRLAAVRWKVVVPWAVATFVVVMVAITAFELIGGRSVASYTGGTDDRGGTSIGRVVEGGGSDGKRESPAPTPTPAPSDEPSSTPSEQPTPSETPTAEPTPTDGPTDLPTESVDPNPTPDPTEPASPTGPVEPSPSGSNQ